MTATPPEWAEALLRLVLDRDHADSVSGDLLEEYRATVHPARGQSRADRWYVMQTFGYVARSAGFWAAIFGGAFVGRTSLDWLAPTDDFHVRSAVSTSVGVGTLMVAGLWAGWRSSRFAAGTLAGLATAGFGAVVSIVGAVVFSLSHTIQALWLPFAAAVGWPKSLLCRSCSSCQERSSAPWPVSPVRLSDGFSLLVRHPPQ